MKKMSLANKTIIGYKMKSNILWKMMVLKFGATPEQKEVLFSDIGMGNVSQAIDDLKRKYPDAVVIGV